ncbi:uncharacterized protein PITG_16307 [Phytophthora infestans T30-4]|uniref:Uncharacterized protein n=1 Tax=Phytophthora infestans (strain T30-4) TaxID=403677 RepID=D0NTZ0_PHYIT|nr:uncharacterized protein PITG_16307 [Phytophthora infestans T30-4]EEY65114.1 hypothetical protein PITG_16307 [Phytophthora infestans T30-4]|eukprot:XP_002897371.1 hypothetical protein PITG_16307 [Phytophthora infestans T30-4]
MSGFYSDNQTKQNAFDRYYNAMAKSDFVQGKKLKALIRKENLDDASTDSLAHLFQQVMGKKREYEYDQITKKQLKVRRSIHTFRNQLMQTLIWMSPLHLKNHSRTFSVE